MLTTAQYVAGLKALGSGVSEKQRRMLVAQYHAPDRTVTSPHLALLADIEGGMPTVNRLYGGLGRKFCNKTGDKPDIRTQGRDKGKAQLWTVWSSGWHDSQDIFHWKMLPEVAAALEELGWVQPA